MSPESGHFPRDWLTLREPFDAAARSEHQVDRLDGWLSGQDHPGLIDLGAGHGSNLRYLAPRLKGWQWWLLIDHDADLLDHAVKHSPTESSNGQPVELEYRTADLNDLPALDLSDPDVITASALLDLCSQSWIEMLVGKMAHWRCAGLFSLNVDGQRHFIDNQGHEIVHRDDARMGAWFNAHQRQAKGLGLGPALGPDAVNVLTGQLEQAGFKVFRHASPWQLLAGDPDTAALTRTLVDGWRQTALEMAPEQAGFIDQWHQQRLDWLEHGKAGLMVGHVDLLALPANRND